MKQATFGLSLDIKKTRNGQFLEHMDQVVPCAALVELIARYCPEGRTGRPPYSVQTMLRTYFIQLWFTLSDPATQEAFFEVPLYREFAQLDEHGRMPDGSTILCFRQRLEKYQFAEKILASVNVLHVDKGLLLKVGTTADATLIAAHTSTKKEDKARDSEMHSSKKGNQWYFGMKAHIGVEADSGLVHSIIETATNFNEVTQGHGLLHGEEKVVFADAS